MTARSLLAALLPAAVVAGCGITNPYTPNHATTTHAQHANTTAPVAAAKGTDPSEPPPSKTTTTATSGVTAGNSASGAEMPRQALRLYWRLYVNWTAKTIEARQRRLAALSQGTARAAALQAAASYSRDPELEHSHVANSGAIVSIAPGQGPQRGSWVIVTTEHTTGTGDYTGLPAAAHVTYAHLTHTPHGWVITQWSPQS